MFFKLLLPWILATSSETFERRIDAASLLGDATTALKEAREYIIAYPDSKESYKRLICAYAKVGQEQKMLSLWEEYKEKFHDDNCDLLLEEMCWGVLKNGHKSSLLTTRHIALIGAALSQDAKALPFICDALNDSNALFRASGVKLASFYGDKVLLDRLKELFYSERSWEVREELYEAVAKLQMRELLPSIETLLLQKGISSAERKSAFLSIVELKTEIPLSEIEELSKSKSAAFRILSCALLAKELKEASRDLLIPLLADPLPEVKEAACFALAILGEKRGELFEVNTIAKDSKVAISAAFALYLADPLKGEAPFRRFLGSSKANERRLAASALASCGGRAIALMKEILKETEDPYVALNVAVGLLRQREEVNEASHAIYTFLRDHKEKLMWREGFFKTLDESDVKHDPLIANYPEALNQIVRLELLNLLALCHYPQAHLAIKEFLKEKRWEIAGVAAEVLLGEGDEEAIELVQSLLEDKDREIRVNAALLLATWGRDEKAIPILLQNYPNADRMLKIKILESLGRIGSRETIPFLIERMKEPSQLFRMIAAAILIQILHH